MNFNVISNNNVVINKDINTVKTTTPSIINNKTVSLGRDRINISVATGSIPPNLDNDPSNDTFSHKIKHFIGKAVSTAGRVPVIRDIGYKFLGMISKPDGDSDDKPMGNIGYLTPNLIRGSQPLEADFVKLKDMGVNTVINLRPEANWEKPIIKKNGMKEIYIPEPAFGRPTNKQATDFLNAVTDPKNGKIFFHCQHGADRTGAMAAAYRIAIDGWTADQAIAEMPKYNFHEGIEDSKLEFVRSFEVYWKDLPQQEKNKILHK